MNFSSKRRKTHPCVETVRCCQSQQSGPVTHGLARCQWTLFLAQGSLAPCSRCACGLWLCETHRTMGQHNCTLINDLESRKGPGGEASPPYSPTEPGDSEPEDGQMIWGDDIGHVPTPTRRNLSISVREDSSPGGGPSDHEGHQPCGFCYCLLYTSDAADE